MVKKKAGVSQRFSGYSYPMNSPTLRVRLPAPLLAALLAEARRRTATPSTLVRECLQAMLGDHSPLEKRGRPRKATPAATSEATP